MGFLEDFGQHLKNSYCVILKLGLHAYLTYFRVYENPGPEGHIRVLLIPKRAALCRNDGFQKLCKECPLDSQDIYSINTLEAFRRG